MKRNHAMLRVTLLIILVLFSCTPKQEDLLTDEELSQLATLLEWKDLLTKSNAKNLEGFFLGSGKINPELEKILKALSKFEIESLKFAIKHGDKFKGIKVTQEKIGLEILNRIYNLAPKCKKSQTSFEKLFKCLDKTPKLKEIHKLSSLARRNLFQTNFFQKAVAWNNAATLRKICPSGECVKTLQKFYKHRMTYEIHP